MNYTTHRKTSARRARHRPALATAPPVYDCTMTTPHQHITGAELQTLREACNLSREDFAELADVQARTVKHWENGRSGVPADVSALALKLDTTLTEATAHALDTIKRAHLAAGTAPADLALVRYRTAHDLRTNYSHAGQPSPAGDMPPELHAAIVGRVRLVARHLPQWAALPMRVVWFEPADYAAWLASTSNTDTSESRAAWAALQVAPQAIPHRADQPPAR
jgi:DNA-binding transcriptional regulator YiaG